MSYKVFGDKNVLDRIWASVEQSGKIDMTLTRRWLTANTSIGILSINGIEFSYTLEDVVRSAEEGKVWGKTAIPYGTYSVTMTKSGISYKFNTINGLLPLLNKVPGFTGIRIHPGNRAGNTEGCVLVGYSRGNDFIGDSTKCFGDLYKLLYEGHLKDWPMKIKVTNFERKIVGGVAAVLSLLTVFF